MSEVVKPPKVQNKSPRRRAREFALQALYEWQLSGNALPAIEARMADAKEFDRADTELMFQLLRGVIKQADALAVCIGPHLDRPLDELSPVERNILLLAAFELAHKPETPYRVIINEAVELAKVFGGADGHKFVNGVLDRLAQGLRATEIAYRAAGNAQA